MASLFPFTLFKLPLIFCKSGQIQKHWIKFVPTIIETDQLLLCRQRGQVVECHDCDRHGLGSKPTRIILLCPWERHFTAVSRVGALGKQF